MTTEIFKVHILICTQKQKIFRKNKNYKFQYYDPLYAKSQLCIPFAGYQPVVGCYFQQISHICPDNLSSFVFGRSLKLKQDLKNEITDISSGNELPLKGG